jgi:hypothetical protein
VPADTGVTVQFLQKTISIKATATPITPLLYIMAGLYLASVFSVKVIDIGSIKIIKTSHNCLHKKTVLVRGRKNEPA